MAGHSPKLVNKQFNSPIGLYSENNIKDILERESKILANGVVGIDFHNPITTKPGNLHNSAVLRMLEEEESRHRNGQYTGIKRVAWPPPREGEDLEETGTEAQGVVDSLSPVSRPNYQQPPAVVNTYQPPRSQTPIICAPNTQNTKYNPTSGLPTNNPTSPISPGNFGTNPLKPWAPVKSPVKYNSEISQEIPYHQPATTILKPQTQQSYQQPILPVKQFEPPPSTITLRPKVPISQAPAPVFSSQPATATLRGGKNLRGDLKWPPEDVKDRMEAENRQRMDLAKGPAFRPRKVKKDYSSFFAQHALNSTYPGYKIPPGTQYYDHHPVM